jgi:hypothetical protein|tara:strand:+ start:344 stop:589 length:246 start_codon:yes stop_codon:yes gene_type:complete
MDEFNAAERSAHRYIQIQIQVDAFGMQIEQTQNILCELCGTNHVFSDSAVFTFCDDCSKEVEELGIEEEDIISTGKIDEEE